MKTTLRQQKAARRELALSLARDVNLSVRVCVCVCADNQRTTFGCRVGIVTGHGRDAVAAGVGGGVRNESGKGAFLWADVVAARSLFLSALWLRCSVAFV